uniref:non-specific serine/threonine protein kinase n=1 Tax=Erpetoichthys calabaricus TaxID=27687 RepID=A0A8C4SMK3_ERPCA
HFFKSINLHDYYIEGFLRRGAFGKVMEGYRMADNLPVRRIPSYFLPPTCPNIIRLLDWTETASVYIMVIERPFFCQDLSDFMHSQGGKLSEPVAKCFFKQITEAVQYCHFKGVFHNDVKKENILVVTGTFQLKLIDFGCGFFLKDTEYSGHRFLYNTFRAIPSTVWTLGVNLFEMVSGFLPFSSIDDILRNTPPFLFGISEECRDLIKCCLTFDSNQRPCLEDLLPCPGKQFRNLNWFDLVYNWHGYLNELRSSLQL